MYIVFCGSIVCPGRVTSLLVCGWVGLTSILGVGALTRGDTVIQMLIQMLDLCSCWIDVHVGLIQKCSLMQMLD